MKKQPAKKKKFNLTVECQEEESNLASSVYSEIGPDGLIFLKYDIKVGKDGLTSQMIGNNQQNHIIRIDDIQGSGKNIGGGSAASVEEGIYKPQNVRVAIKKINVYDKEKRHQLMNDIKSLLQNKIKQENNKTNCNFFVNLYGAFYDQGVVKVILELMDVGSLSDILKILKAGQQKEPLIDEVILAKIAQQILNGLLYLHVVNNQVHRDIKPANILMNSKGEVKLTDFGIMKELEDQDQFCQTFVGTKAYMSPERIEGKQYNNKSDIWSFGMILLELATGKYPYPDDVQFIDLLQYVVNQDSPQLPSNGKYSNEFIDFVNKCLQKVPRQRSSAIELLAHPWILNNTCKDYEIVQWLNRIKIDVMPKAIQQQKLQQKKNQDHIQQQVNQFKQQ